jgi:hypothetical protein
MISSDRPDAGPRGDGSPASGPLPESDPMFTENRSSAKARAIRSRGVLGRLADRWRQILVLWLVASAPIAFLVFLLTQPTYQAFSVIRILPALPRIVGPA